MKKHGGERRAMHPGERLSAFIDERTTEIIEEWKARARNSVSASAELSDLALTDELPSLLHIIARFVAKAPESPAPPASLDKTAGAHAVDRLTKGFDLEEVIREYALLRRVVLDLWERYVGSAFDVAELRLLDGAFDEAISQSSRRYGRGRERMLYAVDRISEAAFGTVDLDVFLDKLARATVDLLNGVTTVIVLLRDGDVLRVHTCVGMENEFGHTYSLVPGESFGADVVAARAPILVKRASEHPSIKSEAVRAGGVKTVYGVPLIHDGVVVGVAHMLSSTANEFSDEDMLLFRLMTGRATAVIVQAELMKREQASRAAAEESAALLSLILHNAPVGFALLDHELRYVRINDALAAAHGRSPAEHVGQRAHDVLGDDGADIEAALARVIATGEPIVGLEHTTRTGRKTEHWLMSYYPVKTAHFTGVGKIAVDITERKNAADAQRLLAEAGARLSSSLDVGEVARTLATLFVPHLADGCSIEIDGSSIDVGARRGAVLEQALVARHRALGTVRLFRDDPFTAADIEATRDLASRAALAADNAVLYQAAQRSATMREEILAVVSHDLKNPLNAIVLAAALATKAVQSERGGVEKQIDTIQRNAQRMNALIGDLLTMASIQAGRLPMAKEPAAVDDLLREAVTFHEPLAEERGVTLSIASHVNGARVAADGERLLQVFSNLIGNAIKFSAPRGTITLQADASDGDVVFAVKDEGPGIKADEIGHVFEPYWSAAARHQKKGTGLGLYIAKGIVEAHGGRIWVESSLGEGTTFRFSIPLASKPGAT